MPLYRFTIETPWAQDDIVEEVWVDDDEVDEADLDAILDVVYANNFPASIEQVEEDGEDDEWE